MKLTVILLWILSGILMPLQAQRHAVAQVFYNGIIFTAEPTQPTVEAIAVKGDKIIATGSKAAVLRAAGKKAILTDLQGKCLLPGLIDSHIHVDGGGGSLITADLADAPVSLEELEVFAEDSRKNGKAMYENVMSITGLNLSFWTDPEALSAIFDRGEYTRLPVFLIGMDYHTGWANRAMLEKAGINRDYLKNITPSERQLYGFLPDFSPNGLIREAAMDKVFELIPEMPENKKLLALKTAIQHCNSLGLTGMLDPGVNHSLDLYKKVAASGDLTAHVAGFISLTPGQDPDAAVAGIKSIQSRYQGIPGFTVAGIKIFADGVVEYPAQTAAMSRPYRNSGLQGDMLFQTSDFARLAIAADKAGLIVHVHAIGDKAVTETLDGFEQVRRANGNSGLPHTITHLQFVVPADYPRFANLGIIASFQLYWASADTLYTDLVKPYIDPLLYAYQYPASSMEKAGTIIAGASDWPVSTPNPFEAMYVAETRRGFTEIVLNAQESLSRKSMLYAYTINAARAMQLEDSIGSIKAGKQADLVLLDRDVTSVSSAEMKETKVLWTMVGGKMVYRRL
jgi:predicted amidohydrolase YtcJ